MRSRLLRALGCAVLIGAAALPLAGCEGAGPEEGGPGPTQEPFSLQVGDCIAPEEQPEAAAPGATPGATPTQAPLQSLPVVPCEEPHIQEVFVSFQLPNGPFPGDSLIIDAANDGCLDAFDGFVGLPASESELRVRSLYPTQGSWLGGDREVLCLVGDPEGPTTGSLFGAQR